LGPLGTAVTHRPIVPPPGDYDDGKIGGMMVESEKTCPSAALSTTNPTCCPDANPGRGGKPATNRLSYGTAKLTSYLHLVPRIAELRISLHAGIRLHGVVYN
jgi:hypothetical protein